MCFKVSKFSSQLVLQSKYRADFLKTKLSPLLKNTAGKPRAMAAPGLPIHGEYTVLNNHKGMNRGPRWHLGRSFRVSVSILDLPPSHHIPGYFRATTWPGPVSFHKVSIGRTFSKPKLSPLQKNTAGEPSKESQRNEPRTTMARGSIIQGQCANIAPSPVPPHPGVLPCNNMAPGPVSFNQVSIGRTFSKPNAPPRSLPAMNQIQGGH